MIDVVVDSLEGFAEEAELDGDAKFASNCHAVACTITGAQSSECELRMVEMLVEQAISLMHAYKNRRPVGEIVN
jgi:hypothetical protein